MYYSLYYSSMVFSIRTQQTFACSKSTIKTKLEICSQLKELQNHDRDIIFVLTTKISENSTNILNYYVSN